MSRNARIVLVALLTAGALLFGTVALAAVAAYRQGSVAISMDAAGPAGDSFSLRVPAFLLTGAVALVPDELIVPDEAAATELRRFAPLARSASEELLALPDVVFVEVISGRDHVRVEKRDGHLVVRVQSPEENVEISVPLRAAASLLARVERAARAAG